MGRSNKEKFTWALKQRLADDRLQKTAGFASTLFGGPVRGVGNTIKSVLLGAKGRKGALPGTRKELIPGLKGLTEISKGEHKALAKEITADPSKGVVEIIRNAKGKKVYTKRRTTYGGLVGSARKHPVIAAGAGVMAYGAANPATRPMVQGMTSGGSMQNRQDQMQGYQLPSQRHKGPWG